MSGWNKKQTVLRFIEIYRTLPALWKVKSKGYSNKLTRELAYSKLIEFCRKFDPSADRHYVVNKVNNLRSSFRKELKKVEASKLSGADSDKVYESKLWYFPHLLFIQDQEVTETDEVTKLDMDSVHPQNTPVDSSRSLNLTVDSEVPKSPSASSEIPGLDVPESNQTEDFTKHETLSQGDRASGVSSPDSSCSLESTQGLFLGLKSSEGPSHESSNTQGPFPVALYPGPPQTSFCSTPQGFSGTGRPASKTPTSTTKRPNKRKHEEEEILTNGRARLVHPVAPHPSPMDENESFGKTIALLLKNASREQRIFARKLMYEVMTEAELGNLSRQSYFVASPDFSTRRAENVEGRHTSSYHKQ